MTESLPPLTWQTSANTAPEVSNSLPESVVSCLQNARYLHLATCLDLRPHVSLMNYTYLPSNSTPPAARPALPTGPIIIMTTNPSSRKTLNLLSNPNVSLLVHDWVSSRPPAQNPRLSPPPAPQNPSAAEDRQAGQSSLASLLMGLNTSSLGSISATINGTAEVLERGTASERWCRDQHLLNNGFADTAVRRTDGVERLSGSPEQSRLAEAEQGRVEDDVRVVVVRIKDGTIADHKGQVRDFVLTPLEG